MRRKALAADRHTGGRVKEMQPGRLNVDASVLAFGQGRLRVHPGDQRGQRGDVLRGSVRVVRDCADPAVNLHVGAEFFTKPDGQLDDRGGIGIAHQRRI